MNPQRQYQDDEDSEPNIRPKFGVVQGGGESTPPSRGHLHAAPDAAEEPSSLRALEGGGETSEPVRGHLRAVDDNDSLAEQENDTLGRGFTGTGTGAKSEASAAGKKKKGLLARVSSLRSKKWLIAGGIGGAGVVGIIIFLLLLASSLKIPDLAQNITNYEFARLTRQFTQSADRTTGEALAVEAASEGAGATAEDPKGVYGALKDKYQNVRDNTWGKLDKFRPDKVIDNLGENHGLSLNFKTSRLTGREIFTGMTVDGVTYPVEQVTGIAKWTPVLRKLVAAQNQAKFAKVAVPALDNAMQSDNVGTLIRNSVANRLRKLANISLVAWNVQRFESDDAKQARLEEARQKYSKVDAAESQPNNTVTGEIKDAQEAAVEAEQETVNDPQKLQAAIDDNGVAADAITATENQIKSSLTDDVIRVINPLYAIATPLCIIYDGSIQQSGPTINNQTQQQMAAYYYVASAADQQKAGSQSTDPALATGLANAISATNDDLGDVNQSNALLRANGVPVDSSSSLSAEAGADGGYNFSMLNALGVPAGSPEGAAANYFTGHVCGLLTSTYTAAGIGVANLLASILSFGGTEAGEEAAGQGARVFITSYVKDLSSNLFGKQIVKDGVKTVEKGFLARAKSYIGKQAAIVGGTIGATELANLITASRAGEVNSGLNQGADLANEADSGGNLVANQLQQSQMFGRPLNASEVNASAQVDREYLADQNKSQDFYQRYLATSNAGSLVSRMAISLSGSLNGSFTSSFIKVSGTLLHPLTYFGSLFTSLNGRALAAPTDLYYHNVQFGMSNTEEQLADSNKSYAPLENQLILDQSGQEDAIAQEYAVCFGYRYDSGGDGSLDPTDLGGNMQLDSTGDGSIGSLLAAGPDGITRDSDGNVTNGGLCSPLNLGTTNPKYGDLVFRWRLASQYDTTLPQMTNLQEAPNAPTPS